MEPDDIISQDLCRVCRCEGGPDRPLFHPCICTGSIKYIHQECLLQWLRYSKKDICELCNHKFSFTPIYSPDMPKRLPLSIVLSGFLSTIVQGVRFWIHYTLVAFAWIGIVPLTACRIYRTLFTGSVSSILSLPLDMLSTENLTTDILHGCAVVVFTLLAFIGLVWLRDQILHGGGPDWLDIEDDNVANNEDVDIADNNPEGIADDNNNNGDLEEPDRVPAEPAAPEILDNNEVQEDVQEGLAGDDGQWNPIEWDRGAEDMTWERLFGLDGSLVFLEHVFWVVSLNTIFILIFAFLPYHIGHFTIMGFKLKSFIGGSHFEGMLTTLYGYCILGISLVIIHSITSLMRLQKLSRFLGQCYVVVKVALLLVIEIFAFPVVCGWWLDICSLSLFDATLKDRQASYHQSPAASIFIHWLVGMTYVFYFASFVILLREVLRPGVLWFLRNLNDPDFNPIQEMIHLSIAHHLKRFCASLVMFGISILIMLYLPSRIIKHTFVDFLPYQTVRLPDSRLDELTMELILFLIILPTLQDHNNMREWLKSAIRVWCIGASWILDLRSYLFGDVPLLVKEDQAQEEQEVIVQQQQPQVADGAVNAGGGLGAAHQAFLHREGPTRFQPYNRPNFFVAKIIGLLILMLLSWLIVSLLSMLVPVWFGRQFFSLWLRDDTRVYELYTSALGLFVCLSLIKGITLLVGWIRQGCLQLSNQLREWAIIGLKASVAAILLMGMIPLMVGRLLELVIFIPASIPLYQTPVFYVWKDLTLGVLYTKITIALTWLGPDWWLKDAIVQLCADGFRGLDLGFLMTEIIVPVCTALGLALSIPYIIAHSLAPLIFSDQYILILFQRGIYAFLLSIIVTVIFIVMQLKQFKKLYEHIKNDRYLVGKRLVNYNPSKSSS